MGLCCVSLLMQQTVVFWFTPCSLLYKHVHVLQVLLISNVSEGVDGFFLSNKSSFYMFCAGDENVVQTLGNNYF